MAYPRRWASGLLAFAALLGACGGVTDSQRLLSRLGAVRDEDRFAFEYQALGTDVLGCALPNRAFRVEVDRQSGVLVLSDERAGPFAVNAPGRVVLARRLFATPPADGNWVEAALPLDDAVASALRQVLGPDAAGYALTDGLPTAPTQSVATLVDSATSVERQQGDATGGTDVFVLRLPGDAVAMAPDADVRVTVRAEGGVQRIDVVPVAEQPDAEPAAGWALEVARPSSEPLSLPRGPTVDVETLDVADLRPRPMSNCELGV